MSGTQEIGTIEFIQDDDVFTCQYDNVLPKFCKESIDAHNGHQMNLRELKNSS